MLDKAIEARIQRSVLSALLAMTLLVTPWMNLDPINLPKFFVLMVFSLFVLGLLLVSIKGFRSDFKLVAIGVTLFALFALLSTLVNGFSFAQLFGAFGRNTGFLAYLGLSVLLLGAAVSGRRAFAGRVIYVLIGVSLFNLFYGLLQWRGLDPVDWANPYDPIVGTLGNPNFTSALLGMGAVAIFALILTKLSWAIRSLWLVLLALALFISYESDAIQGLGVFAIGAVIVIYYRFFRNKGMVLRAGYLVAIAGGGLVAILGILQKGPLASVLYQSSVTYRGDYWRAGWKMTLDHPIFGVGMDQYGDWYRAARTEAATLRRGPDVTSNSAHNVFFDISSNGGFPLLIAYLFLLALAFRSAIRILKRSKDFDFVSVALVAAWVGYIAQSTVSINQLGLAIWGWVLSGAIIGLDHYGSDEGAKVKSGQRQLVPPKAVITGSLGLALGALVAFGPIYQDVQFRSALTKSDAQVIKAAALNWPTNTYYLDYAANIFIENKFEDFALELSLRSTELNSRNFAGWNLLYKNPKTSAADKEKALAQMKELDPFNNTLK